MKAIVRKWFALGLALSLVLTALTGCSGGGAESSVASGADGNAGDVGDLGKTITYGLSGTWATLMPFGNTIGTYIAVAELLYEPLATTTDKIVYRNAESIDLSEDGRTWTVHLNKGVTWADGEPTTAEDWVWTLQTATDPDFGVYTATSYFATIAGTDSAGLRAEGETLGVELVDDYTFTIQWKDPMSVAGFLGSAGYFYHAMPKHLLENIPVSELAGNEYWNHPVANGCCEFVAEPVKGEELILSARDNFYLGDLDFDTINFKVIAVANAGNALLNGDIDTYYSGITSAVQAEIDGKNGVHFEIDPAIRSLSSMTINNERFNTNVRKAFDLLLDKEVIGKAMCGEGNYEVAGDPFLSSMDYFQEYHHERNVEKAVEMLKAENWDFENNVVHLGCAESRQNLALIIQQNLAEGGVKVEIELGEGATILAKQDSGELDCCLVSNNVKFSGTAHSARFAPDTGTMTHTTDTTIRDLSNEIDFCQDEARETQLLHQLQEYYWQECPWLFLYTTPAYIPHSSRVSGIRTAGYTFPWEWVVSD